MVIFKIPLPIIPWKSIYLTFFTIWRLMWTPLSVPCQMSEWESFIRFQTETEAFDYSITLDEIELNNKFDCWKMVSQKTLGNQTIKAWNNWSSLFQTHLHHIKLKTSLKVCRIWNSPWHHLYNPCDQMSLLFLDRIAICLQLIKLGEIHRSSVKLFFLKKNSWTN